MAIVQTIVGVENNFRGRASVLSRTISHDNETSNSETSFLILSTDFDMRRTRVHTRARSERQIPTDIISDVIQRRLATEIGDSEIDVSIGAMYTDDLPISGHEYSNIFIVVSWDMTVDIPLPRDAHINVELYFGWRQVGNSMVISDDWYHNVSVSNVGRLRKRKAKAKAINVLTSNDTGPSAGQQIRDGIRPFFTVENINGWYVIPGTGLHHTYENNIAVRRDASFWVIE